MSPINCRQLLRVIAHRMICKRVSCGLWAAVAITTLGGCGATSPSAVPVVAEKVSYDQQSQPQRSLEQQLLLRAESVDANQQMALLLAAAEQYQKQNCAKARFVSSAVESHLPDIAQRVKARIIIAECLFAEGDYASATVVVDSLVEHGLPMALQQRQKLLKASLQAVAEQYWDAAKTLAGLTHFTYDTANHCWQLLSLLDSRSLRHKIQDTQLATFSQQTSTGMRLHATAQLVLALRRFAQQPKLLSQAVRQWRVNNPSHPLVNQLPASVRDSLTSSATSPRKIAVLLPLSGQLKTQGQSIKEGIISAFFAAQQRQNTAAPANPMPELLFVDSNNDTRNITQQITSADFVIGPLVKSKIVALASEIRVPSLALNFINSEASSLSQRQDGYGTPTALATNRDIADIAINEHPRDLVPMAYQSGPVDQLVVSHGGGETPPLSQITGEKAINKYFFALSPEDEAIQMARHLNRIGIQYPLVVQADNRAAARMNKAFTAEWNALGHNPIEVITVSNAKSMRNDISGLLGVSQSKRRVKQIQALVKTEVHTFERNRRDADAVVIFANATETELINPIIESSISPFATIIPVFASSRSYSHDRAVNSLRDLRNLRFIDMPWMLPDHNYKTLQNALANIQEKRTDAEYRLFAMGYDAFNVIGHLRPLQRIQQYRFSGLTGDIYMDPQQRLRRILSWGQIRNDKVVKLPQT